MSQEIELDAGAWYNLGRAYYKEYENSLDQLVTIQEDKLRWFFVWLFERQSQKPFNLTGPIIILKPHTIARGLAKIQDELMERKIITKSIFAESQPTVRDTLRSLTARYLQFSKQGFLFNTGITNTRISSLGILNDASICPDNNTIYSINKVISNMNPHTDLPKSRDAEFKTYLTDKLGPLMGYIREITFSTKGSIIFWKSNFIKSSYFPETVSVVDYKMPFTNRPPSIWEAIYDTCAVPIFNEPGRIFTDKIRSLANADDSNGLKQFNWQKKFNMVMH